MVRRVGGAGRPRVSLPSFGANSHSRGTAPRAFVCGDLHFPLLLRRAIPAVATRARPNAWRRTAAVARYISGVSLVLLAVASVVFPAWLEQTLNPYGIAFALFFLLVASIPPQMWR